MVSPCIDSRLSSRVKDIRFSTSQHRAIVEKSAPPPEFQFSSGNVKVCGQPKQSRARLTNGVSSDARRLGNVRAALLHSGAEEIIIVRKKSKGSSSSESNEGSVVSKSKRSKKKANLMEKAEVHASDEIISKASRNLAPASELEKRRRMAATLNAMLGGSTTRKNSLRYSLPGFHEQKAPDARNDPYNVHKWRRKSSRKKYAGMQPSPAGVEQDLQAKIGKSMMEACGSEYQAESIENEQFSRKPHVPLPGFNMLPALHIHNRSELGSGRAEVTLKFARNAAMEELERRFHDNSWKSKRVRRLKPLSRIENQSLGDLTREKKRTNALRKAASIRAGHVPAGLTQNDEEAQNTSVMQTIENLMESPDKQHHRVSFMGENPPTPQHVYLSPTFTIQDTLNAGSMGQSENNSQAPLADAMQFKRIEDGLSEETVTIISKPSAALSPTKRSTPGISKKSLSDESLDTDFTAGVTDSSLKHSTKLPSELAHRSSERKFPVLPEFSKSPKAKYQDGSVIFGHLQQTMSKQNEKQYRKYSRNNILPSLENDTPRAGKQKRVTLPPLSTTSNHKHGNVSEKRTAKRKPKITDQSSLDQTAEDDSLSPLGSSPTRKKLAHPSKTSPLSYASSGTRGAKELSSTPVDSVGSDSTAGGRRRSKQWRRRSRVESKGSPQFQKAQKLIKIARLMQKWRAAIRLTIMFNRLCREHRMVSDDSYNIHFAATGDMLTGVGTKPEVLFDVTDYKTKNQQKLSDTTRRILSTPSEDRTEQDVRMIQTTLRNVKAIADHSAPVQSKIAKAGYVVAFESKRVVILENRKPLNFYVLLAGSAVIIKEDENGNTNPISFMKRGDIFGEREILDNCSWEWSVVTVDPCEFLLLDREDYVKIFLAAGSGGLLSDPDRGTFMKSLPLFHGWPTQLLEANPNRCLFRYYKRGALLARDNAKSDWIFVIKSGSCFVLKPLTVERLTSGEIYRRQMAEQTAVFPAHLNPQLVEKTDDITEEEHLQKISDITEVIKAEQVSVATSYHQIEMASLLKELNIDIKDGILTPLHEEEEEEGAEEEGGTEVLLNQSHIPNQYDNPIPISVTEGEIDPYVATHTPNGEFRMSRVSDRGVTARTPSPMKAAYLQTGITFHQKEEKERMLDEGNLRTKDDASIPVPVIKKIDIDDKIDKETIITDPLSTEDFLSKLETASVSESVTKPSVKDRLKPVYVNIRKLTKGCSFGLDSVLFNDQPSLALVSNGAECLLLNKKFYLDNMTDEVLRHLRDAEHPYPTESELLEDYWRLISWKSFQQRTVQGVFRRKARVRHYMNPPKTDVY